MHREFKLAYGTAILLVLGVLSTLFFANARWTITIGIGLLALGSFLVAFGFWGADYAFSTAIGELDQSHQTGKVKGERGKVYVPFMANYTAVEWWNLNWFLITIGLFCAVFGAYFIGSAVGKLVI